MFSGVTLGTWLQVLRDNSFSIDSPYWPRALHVTLLAVSNTLVGAAEHWWFHRAIERTEVSPPLFVLGTWRSGTTHLHNLLAVDKRFAYPNLYQVICPSTFLLSEASTSWFVDLWMPKQRPQDAVKFGVNEPQEEDFAMCVLTGQASLLEMAFPRNAAFYERYMTMVELVPSELARWKESYQYFLKKLTYKYRRPLVLKTPANTGRIETLLEMFPDAKFVNIHRNPYDVFSSAKHMFLKAGPWWQLQRIDYQDDEAINRRLLRQGTELYDRFFAQRSLIPPGRLHDVEFADLERDPVGQLESIYQALSLDDFHLVKPRLCEYVRSLTNYKKNTHSELPEKLRQQIHQNWKRYFDEWGYAA